MKGVNDFRLACHSRRLFKLNSGWQFLSNCSAYVFFGQAPVIKPKVWNGKQPWSLHDELVDHDTRLFEDFFQPRNMILVGMSVDHDIDVFCSVPIVQVFDDGLTIPLIAPVNYHYELLALDRIFQIVPPTHANGVSAVAFVAYGKEVDFKTERIV